MRRDVFFPDVSKRTVVRNIFDGSRLPSTACCARQSKGPCYRKINSAPTTDRKVWGGVRKIFQISMLLIFIILIKLLNLILYFNDDLSKREFFWIT